AVDLAQALFKGRCRSAIAGLSADDFRDLAERQSRLPVERDLAQGGDVLLRVEPIIAAAPAARAQQADAVVVKQRASGQPELLSQPADRMHAHRDSGA